MIVGILISGVYCPDVNQARQEFIDKLEQQHKLEVEYGERNDTFKKPPPYGYLETACYYQDAALGQVAILVLLLAGLR